MDGDRKPCTRATCNKAKCCHLNKATNRAPQTPTKRPGADQMKAAATPVLGGGVNSTQILYVEPNFSETPSEYDIFYDCYSDVELNPTECAIMKTKTGSCGPRAATPTGRDSKMFRDALKQVIVNAQALLVDYESGGRGGRRGCGSRCRCDVRNMKPQTRTVQLEVTAKVAPNKSATQSNIRIDPITFTIPLKLHLQGQKQSQQNLDYTPSQQSYEGRRPFGVHEHAQNMPCHYGSMEPIRTAIITGTRQEAVSLGVPMQGLGPGFDFNAALLQQMMDMPVGHGLMQFPMMSVEEFGIPPPPQTQMGRSRTEIRVRTPAALKNFGNPTDVKAAPTRSKVNLGETCSVDPLTTPSLAPVNKGNFLATIATSSVPSVVNVKSREFSETGSKGVCVLCGRGGDSKTRPTEVASKGPCNMCTKGKPQTAAPLVHTPAAPQQKSAACGKCSLVVLVPPQPKDATTNRSCKMCSAGPQMKPEPVQSFPKQDDSKGVLKGPCGMCARGVKPTPPAPPPLDEPLIQVKGPCGACTKDDRKPIEPKIKISTPALEPRTTPSGVPCGVCSLTGVPPKIKPSQQLAGEAGRSQCRICSRKVESPAQLIQGLCGDCAGKAAAVEQAPPMEASKIQCGKCSTRGPAPFPSASATCTHTETGPKKGPCGICSKGAPPPPVVGKPSCAICSKGPAAAPSAVQSAVPSVQEVKAPCGVCGRGGAQPVTEAKGPCGVCGRGAVPAVQEVKAPCGVCGRGGAQAVTEAKGPCGVCGRGAVPAVQEVKAPCGVCGRGGAQPVTEAKGPCGACGRGATPPPVLAAPIVEKGPCGVCTRSVAPPTPAPTPVLEKGPCGVCSRGVAPPPPPASGKGACDICSRGAAPPATIGRPPYDVRTSPSAPSVMSVHKEPCDICSRPAAPPAPQQPPAPRAPCDICKKVPAKPEASSNLCQICKRVRAPPEQLPKPELPKKEPCDICSKLVAPSFEPPETKPCGMCGSVGAPCGMCSQVAPSTAPTSANVNQTCGRCNLPMQPKPSTPAPTCSIPTQHATPSTTCGTCLTTPPPAAPSPPPVIDYSCGTCLLPKPKEICSCIPEIGPKFYKALPQHKDIHICSPCRYDPSPLIDEEGKVFCPHNCGCCLCPWRKRGTDSQIDQIKHEKIKVCKCRAKGSIFIDYTSRAKCSNTSYFDCCPCRERAEAKYLEMFGEEMWTPNEKLREKVRGEPVQLEDVVEYKRPSSSS